MQQPIDSKTLAAQLGVTVQTINARARALGLTPDQVKASNGRPKSLWSQEQASAIASYGKTQDSAPTEDLTAVEGDAAAAGYLALQQTVSMPLGQQLSALNQTYEDLEDQAAIAIAHRTSQVLPRAMAKASALLGAQGSGFNLADVARGALGVGPMQPKPIQQSLSQAQLSAYLDNL